MRRRPSTTGPWRAALIALLVLSVATGSAGCERQRRAVEQDLPATRAEKARADAQALAEAVRVYAATFGRLPDSLGALTTVATVDGISGGPFLAAIPTPPAGWSAYEYDHWGDNGFRIHSRSADGAVVSAP